MTTTPDQPRGLRQVPGLVQPTGGELIAAERLRQINKEGRTAAHDDHHVGEELAIAACCYALPETHQRYHVRAPGGRPVPVLWPWTHYDFKPTEARVRDLVKAGALIAAEIDRLQRAAEAAKLAGAGQ